MKITPKKIKLGKSSKNINLILFRENSTTKEKINKNNFHKPKFIFLEGNAAVGKVSF